MNYGKIIKLTYDSPVYNVSAKEKTQFRLINVYNEYLYPANVTYGQNNQEIFLHFENFNNIVEPATFECIGCLEMGSPDLPFDAFSLPINLKNLYPVPGSVDYLGVASVEVAGEILIAFDGKAYLDAYVSAEVAVSGNNQLLIFHKRYLNDTYLNVATVAVSGQYCDINGNPI